LEPSTVLLWEREHDDTSKRQRRNTRAANAVAWPDHS
jgi:hypothetical protein